MNKNINEINKELQDLLKTYDDMDSPQIGLIITWSIEYLIRNRCYDFDKIISTIKKCHYKILKSEESK